ncbi:hypothetical protein BP5796_00229 [Coleophoma crateriformis]|uniref:RING-type domain-containing protein n=1 Tax=Coleophoma crateriformis TaxID=565419 RepID=A0A3D8T7D7_9HELO|nr:hypothetical protein BP5796_00229 [Coleophoma crateriformis]
MSEFYTNHSSCNAALSGPAQDSQTQISDSKTETCAIFLEVLSEPALIVPCNHVFDYSCIEKCIQEPHRGRGKCPLCRKEMTHIQPCRLEGAEYSTNDRMDVNSIQPRGETPIQEHPEFYIHEDDDFSEEEDEDDNDDNDDNADENDPLCKSLTQPPLQAYTPSPSQTQLTY